MSGEAFIRLRATDDLTMGVGASLRGGEVLFTIEVQVRLLPYDGPVDVGSVERALAVLVGLVSRGFRLHHYDDAWVTAYRDLAGPESEVAGLAGEVADQLFIRKGA